MGAPVRWRERGAVVATGQQLALQIWDGQCCELMVRRWHTLKHCLDLPGQPRSSKPGFAFSQQLTDRFVAM